MSDLLRDAPFAVDFADVGNVGQPFVCRSCGHRYAANYVDWPPWNGACECLAAWDGEAVRAVRAVIALLPPGCGASAAAVEVFRRAQVEEAL